VRLATYNIKHGEKPGGQVDTALLRDAAAALDADVLCLQEVDRGQPRSHGADQAAEIADAVGAVAYRFTPALTGVMGDSVRRSTPADFAGSAPGYGIAIVSRWPVRAWSAVRVPVLPGPGLSVGKRRIVRRDEARVVMAAVVDGPDGPVTVATAHLSLIRGWNRYQLVLALRAAGRLPGPRLLTGDLNLRPEKVRPVTALTHWRSQARALTFPVGAPDSQIDHVLADRRVAVDGVEARALPVSDHRALVVDLRTVSP
jgi:endonuclease/exonuclease/phosphatase family metal-dependent hydrolase